MEGVTLMESGTSRSHFAFVKRLEAAKSARLADELVVTTIAEVQSALFSKLMQSCSSSSLTSHLLLLIHCIELIPSSNDINLKQPSIQFALIPALHLLAIAMKPKELYIAYSILDNIFAAQSEEEQRQTSLLLLNTIRQHLESNIHQNVDLKGKARSGSREHSSQEKDPIGLAKTSLALKSLMAGVPAGPDIFPALYSPISQLCHHSDESIQRLALDALGRIQSYLDYDEGLARAVWERVRGLVKSFRTKHSGKSKATGDSLARALLRSIKRALDQGVINIDLACDSALSLMDLEYSPALSIACLEFCVDIIATDATEPSILEKLKSAALKVCQIHPSSYSILLSSTSLLGRLAAIDVPSKSSHDIQPVWTLIKSHLSAKNANRKLLLLSTLESFLPFSWFDAGNAAGIELEESEMTILMAMLGENDESIRLRSLHLFSCIDPSLLDSHLSQLMVAATSKDSNCNALECRELCHRALEVASVRYRHIGVVQYSDFVHKLLASPIDDSVDNGLIRLVLRHLRAEDAKYSSQCLLNIIQKQLDNNVQPSSTLALLCASIACEVDCEKENCQDILTQMATMGVHLNGQAALLEALFIGMIKLTLSHLGLAVDVFSTLSKASEGNSSSLVRHRLQQLKEVLQDDGRSINSTILLPSGSLLDTMDRVDAYFIRTKSLPTTGNAIAASLQPFRPLKYEAYSGSTTLSPSSSSSVNKPFSALPPPSFAQDSRTRRQRKQKEVDVRMEMQKSIARLTLDTEYNSEDEEELKKDQSGVATAKDAMLI